MKVEKRLLAVFQASLIVSGIQNSLRVDSLVALVGIVLEESKTHGPGWDIKHIFGIFLRWGQGTWEKPQALPALHDLAKSPT